MRPILILGVLFFTLLTFYSALWYKSEEIEADITTRVTNDLDTAQAKDIAIDVDGRHVTLSGVVYDAETENAYLDTANDTYGALGPIDGLTLQNGGGFLKAVKSDAGIKLTGAVPTDAAREALLAAAADGTDGEVIDAMTVGAATGAWTDEAGFGLSQMAALSSGALSVTPDSYTLSGITTGDANGVRAAVADRAGWSAFVSAPTVETGLTAQLDSLNADVRVLTGERDELAGTLTEVTAERDGLNGIVADLTTDRDGLQATVDTLTGERDTAMSDLDALRASLDDTQTSTANLAGELDGSKAALAIATAQLVEQDSVIEDLTGQVGTLNDELEAQKASMSDDQQAGAELTAKITTLEGELADVTAKAATLETGLGEVTASRDAVQAEVDTLTLTVQDRDAKLAELTDQLEGQSNAGSDAAAQVAALTGQVQNLEAQNGDLTGQVDELSAVVTARNEMIEELKAATPVTTSANAAASTGSTEIAAQCGARAGDVLKSAQINFSSGTANLRSTSVATLERLTGIVLACSDSGLFVEIGGHTDSQGSDESNQVLSERRAKAIAQFMVDRGVSADTLKPVGFGEAQPIGDNETREGRQQNRRISFEWQAR